MSCARQLREMVEPRLGLVSPEMAIWRARPPSDWGGETLDLDLEQELSDLSGIKNVQTLLIILLGLGLIFPAWSLAIAWLYDDLESLLNRARSVCCPADVGSLVLLHHVLQHQHVALSGQRLGGTEQRDTVSGGLQSHLSQLTLDICPRRG